MTKTKIVLKLSRLSWSSWETRPLFQTSLVAKLLQLTKKRWCLASLRTRLKSKQHSMSRSYSQTTNHQRTQGLKWMMRSIKMKLTSYKHLTKRLTKSKILCLLISNNGFKMNLKKPGDRETKRLKMNSRPTSEGEKMLDWGNSKLFKILSISMTSSSKHRRAQTLSFLRLSWESDSSRGRSRFKRDSLSTSKDTNNNHWMKNQKW